MIEPALWHGPQTHTQQHDDFFKSLLWAPTTLGAPCTAGNTTAMLAVQSKKPTLRFQNSRISPLSKVIRIVTHYIWKPTKKKNEERSSFCQNYEEIIFGVGKGLIEGWI